MTRKFKTAGVLTAVVAVFALTAPASQAQFTSSAYPATVTGASTLETFDLFGSTIKCNANSFSGTIASATSTLTLTPTYGCTGGFGLPVTISMTSCKYLFHRNAPAADTVDIDCNIGDAIDIIVYTGSSHATVVCHVKVPAQTGKTGYALTNSSPNVILSGSVANLTATQSRTNAVLCPPGTHTGTATYTIQAGGIKLSGNNGVVSVD